MARLEKLESAIWALEEAIESVKALGRLYGSDVDCLCQMRDMYKDEVDEINERQAAQDEADLADLEREYYRSVL